MTSPSLHTVRVWDLPTRLFHWLLALAVLLLIVTGHVGGNAMIWHFRCGYAVATLLLFRIVWGLVGGRWSRFAAFIYHPGTVLAYLQGRGRPEHGVGHNPLGAGSVFALLLLLLVQVGTGLISDDEIASAGPFVKFVSGTIVSKATFYHADIGQWILVALVVLHVLAIVGYLVRKKENLVRPMLHGNKQLAFAAPASRDDAASRILALVVFGLCAGLVTWAVVRLGG